MSNFEDRLKDSLAEQGAQVDIEGAGPEAAATRALERAKRLSIGRALGALVIVGSVAALAFVQYANDGDTLIEAAEESPTTTVAPDRDETAAEYGAGGDGDTEFAADVIHGGLGWHGKFLTDDGILIRVTTRPGQTQGQILAGGGQDLVVAVSNRQGDIETNDIPDNIVPTAMAYHDGVLYGVSTSPGTLKGEREELIVVRSADFGASWDETRIDLGVDDKDLAEGVWRNAAIAATDAGVLVSLQSNYWVNYEKLLPQYTSNEETYYDIRETRTGLEVRDWTEHSRLSEEQGRECEPFFENEEQYEEMTEEDWIEVEKCWANLPRIPEPDVLESFTWAELGLDGSPRGEEFELFFAPDGKNFEQVESPLAEASGHLVGTDSVYFLTMWPTTNRFEYEYVEEDYEEDLEYYEDPSRYFRSTDGRTWTEVQGAPGGCGIGPSQGDVLISYTCNEDGRIHFSTDGGQTWTASGPVPEDPRADYMSHSQIYGGEMGLVAFRHSERRYELYEDEMGELEEQLGREASSEEDWMEIERKYSELADRSVAAFFSPDGQSWTEIDLPSEIKGREFWISDALIGKNEIVVSVGGNFDLSPRTVWLSPN